MILLLVFILSLIMQAVHKPYANEDLNKIEAVSLFSSGMLVYAGLFFTGGKQNRRNFC